MILTGDFKCIEVVVNVGQEIHIDGEMHVLSVRPHRDSLHHLSTTLIALVRDDTTISFSGAQES